MELSGNLIEIFGSENRPSFHERVMHLPELAGGFRSVFRKLRREPGIFVVLDRTLPEDVSQPSAKSIPQIGDHFMRGVTMKAGITAILDQSHFRVRTAQHMVALEIDWGIQFAW